MPRNLMLPQPRPKHITASDLKELTWNPRYNIDILKPRVRTSVARYQNKPMFPLLPSQCAKLSWHHRDRLRKSKYSPGTHLEVILLSTIIRTTYLFEKKGAQKKTLFPRTQCFFQ